jgi:hypothetical protein
MLDAELMFSDTSPFVSGIPRFTSAILRFVCETPLFERDIPLFISCIPLSYLTLRLMLRACSVKHLSALQRGVQRGCGALLNRTTSADAPARQLLTLAQAGADVAYRRIIDDPDCLAAQGLQ